MKRYSFNPNIYQDISCFLIVLISFCFFYSCAGGNDPDNDALPKFGIYMPVDTTITYEKLQTMNLDTVRIKKWLTDGMIDYYDYSSHLIYLKVDKLSFFPEVQWFYSIEHSYYWNFWMKKRCPFIVITENKRSYAGIFFSNHGLSKPTPHISEIEAFGYADDIIKIALFDDNLANSDYNLAKDIRETEEIKNSLKSAGLFNGGLEYKIDDLKIRSADTIEISASIKNIDRNNLYIFNLRNALYDALKTRPVFIFANKDNTTGYRFTFERIITSDLLNSSDEYFKLEKDKSITFTCTAVCGKKVISSDYYFYSYFYGERSRFEKDKRVKSDGRVWMGKTRSNYMDINYNTSTGVTIKNKDYKFE